MKRELTIALLTAALIAPFSFAETHAATPTPHSHDDHHRSEIRGQLRTDSIETDADVDLGYDTTTSRELSRARRDYDMEYSETEDQVESLSGGYEGEAGAGVTSR